MKRCFFTLILFAACSIAVDAQTVFVPNNEQVNEHAPLTYTVKGTEVLTESGGVQFARNSAEILPKSSRTLQTIKKFLDDKSYISTLRIEGHTDCGDGSQRLSEERALAVVKWLVAAGIDCKRLIPVGFGCTKPIIDVGINERITFVNAALKGHAIGGMPLDGGGKVAGDACK